MTSAAGLPLRLGSFGSETKQMPLVGGHLDPGDDEKPIHRLAIGAHEAALDHVIDRLTGVVVGHGKTMKTLALGGGDECLGTRHAVGAEIRVAMQVEVVRHGTTTVVFGSEMANSKTGRR